MAREMVKMALVRKRTKRRIISTLMAALVSFLCGCRGLTDSPAPVGLQKVNHIIVLAQENRGFDHYFGSLRQYWASNGYPDQSLDGLPQFNPTSGSAPLQGPTPANPGCDPAFPAPGNDCTVDASSPQVASFHMISMCEENPSPSWNEGHVDWNL